MITRVQNKRRGSYSYANDVMTPPSRRNMNRMVIAADNDEVEMIVNNNNSSTLPVVRVTTSAVAAVSNDERKEPPASAIISSNSSNNDYNIGCSTPGRMMLELGKRISSFHRSTSLRNEDSRDDDDINNNKYQ